jgi:antitoxin HicB
LSVACSYGRGGSAIKPQDYEIRIRPLSAEDGGGFIAEVPELPGCMSDGETPQDALENVFDAINCWIEAARKMGRKVPEPKRAAA